MIVFGGVALAPWLGACVAVVLATVSQRLTGGAFGMVAAPLIALLAPERMPAGVLLISLAATLAATPRRGAAPDWGEVAPAALGRGAGALAAAAVVALAPDPGAVAVLVACAVLVGVALSLSGLRLAVTRASLAAAGVVSGLTGTLTSVGAPPMQLLYQHRLGEGTRATLSAFFTIGIVLSLSALAVQSQIGAADVIFAASLAPAAACGLALGAWSARRVTGRALRPVVLGLATAASGAILVRAGLGT